MDPLSTSSIAAERAKRAMTLMTPLPLVSERLPGIGGRIKKTPAHFVVEEMLPYAACGQGEHVYITFRRAGWNTVDAARSIQQRLGLKPSEVGWGGRKDKAAVVIQTFSLRWGDQRALDGIKHALADLPFELLAIERHRNKIKTGHVAANRFSVVVYRPDADAMSRALTIADHLKQTGIPNFYGPQRFGLGMQNIQQGFALFTAEKKARKQPFMVSVVQSVLFNIWLKQRMENGTFQQLVAGDIAKKTNTGGMFTVDDLEAESRRFTAGEIVYTGPIFGYKMKAAADTAGRIESALLGRFGISAHDLRRLRATGSRRQAILNLSDLGIAEVDDGLRFNFTLPAGAYATTVLREFTKTD